MPDMTVFVRCRECGQIVYSEQAQQGRSRPEVHCVHQGETSRECLA